MKTSLNNSKHLFMVSKTNWKKQIQKNITCDSSQFRQAYFLVLPQLSRSFQTATELLPKTKINLPISQFSKDIFHVLLFCHSVEPCKAVQTPCSLAFRNASRLLLLSFLDRWRFLYIFQFLRWTEIEIKERHLQLNKWSYLVSGWHWFVCKWVSLKLILLRLTTTYKIFDEIQ